MIKSTFIVVIALAILAGTQVSAQRGRGMGPMRYDVATEATVVGTVTEVRQLPSPGRGQGGLHLTFGTNEGTFDVHVGPASFVAAKNMSFAAGDSLTVTGSKTTIDGKPVILAREIQKGTEVLKLRTAEGFPLWSGRATR